jgi:hypothetical protein
MGTTVGRIETEFVFRALSDEKAVCEVHGHGLEIRCHFDASDAQSLTFTHSEGNISDFAVGDEIRVFFYLKNNYHTFVSRITLVTSEKLVVEQPKGVYKNLQRKYERILPPEDVEISFSLKGRKVELNFPKSERFGQVDAPELSETFNPEKIHELAKEFRTKMNETVSVNTITMMRDRIPRTWEEKLIVRLGKSLWIPSTDEDFIVKDPSPEDRLITKPDLARLEQDAGVKPHVVSSKLGNILYEKSKKKIFSELYCPILYNEYVVGYIYIANMDDKRERISKELFDYVSQFGKVLCYSLVKNGYFKSETLGERKYEAPIIDISASGLLFTHPSGDLARDLFVHTDLDLTMRIQKRTISIGARIMRKFRDRESAFFGVLFMRIEPEDFRFLFEYLYKKPFEMKYEMSWEGGAPPPAVELW